MRTADFDFELPFELIAQTPAKERDQSRLLVLWRPEGSISHCAFQDLLEHLRPGDVLALNDSRVIPARLRGKNSRTSGQFEVLLLKENGVNDWWGMLRPGKRARLNTRIDFKNRHGASTGIHAAVVETNAEGHRRLQFSGTANITDELTELGEVPLPPYIKRSEAKELPDDFERYQTIYAKAAGSIAAPTAGLHFTEVMLEKIRRMGVHVCFVTLHVGFGTFAPIKVKNISEHVMHEERFVISEETVRIVNAAKNAGRRVIAVGTTCLRVLESVAAAYEGQLRPDFGRTRIFVYPPFRFRVVDALLTNFHLPRSTLLMLVSAFAAPDEMRGREIILSAYAEAVKQRYRFFSYGDAMLIL